MHTTPGQAQSSVPHSHHKLSSTGENSEQWISNYFPPARINKKIFSLFVCTTVTIVLCLFNIYKINYTENRFNVKRGSF